ncbi:MAG TPA: hypothetical protein DGG95_18100 [Cytophagales bacterium]|nr:hypothetical protein [Cytophagales bacterium]
MLRDKIKKGAGKTPFSFFKLTSSLGKLDLIHGFKYTIFWVCLFITVLNFSLGLVFIDSLCIFGFQTD